MSVISDGVHPSHSSRLPLPVINLSHSKALYGAQYNIFSRKCILRTFIIHGVQGEVGG